MWADEEIPTSLSLLDKGENEMRWGKLPIALQYFNQAIEYDDQDEEIYVARANCLIKLGKNPVLLPIDFAYQGFFY